MDGPKIKRAGLDELFSLGASAPGGKDGWLRESDFLRESEFAPPGEGELISSAIIEGTTAEEEATIKRRLLLGGAGTLGLLALAQIPTEDLGGKASKPLFFYLVPVVSSLRVLDELEQEVTDGEFLKLKATVAKILEEPGNLRRNLLSAASELEDKGARDRAKKLVPEIIEYISGVDYNTYFDTLVKPSAKQQLEFGKFSFQSIDAARAELTAFLALMPAEQVQAAESQVDAFNPRPKAAPVLEPQWS